MWPYSTQLFALAREQDTMNPNDLPSDAALAAESHWSEGAEVAQNPPDASDLLSPLLQSPSRATQAGVVGDEPTITPIHGVLLGELLALADDGRTVLVRYPGQPHVQALAARTTVDLQGPHIGQSVVLMFDAGNPLRPIVMGVLRGQMGWPMDPKPAQVEVDADGQRMIVNAKEQLVLRCGKASITLTQVGKVLIEGTHISSRSSGMTRIKGGSVQIN